MINRILTIFIFLFLTVLTVLAAEQPNLDTAFKRADKLYQANALTGLKQFQLLYKKALQTHDQIIEVRCTNIFTEYYWTIRDYRQAMNWGLKSIRTAELYRNDALAGDACVLTGLVCYSSGKYLDAITYYQKAVGYYQKQPIGQRLGLAYMNLGVAERKADRFETANSYYFKAVDIFLQLKQQSYLASVYTAIGNCYAAMDNYQQAIIFQQRSLALFRAMQNPLAEAQALNNMGFAFKKLQKPDSAIIYLERSVSLYATNNDSSSLVTPYQNLGSSWQQKGNLHKAVEYIQRSIHLANGFHMEEELARGQADLAELYIAQRRFGETEKVLAIVGKTADKLHLADLQMETAELNYRLQAALGHDRLALMFYKKRDQIRDSLLTAKKLRAVEDMQIKYETREKERDIADLHVRDRASQKLLGEQRFSIIVLIIAAVLLLALLALAFYSFRAQRRANVLVKELMKEVNHRTKNNLQILSSLLQLQIESQEDQDVKRALHETELRLHAMNIMYSKLYTGQASTTVDMAEYLSSLLAHIQHGFSHERRMVELVKDLDQILLPTDKAVLLGLILNELCSNSIRHALPSRGLVLTINLKRKDSQMAVLSIRDNGKAKKKNEKTSENSFGLRIVDLIIDQLEADIVTEPANPYAYFISFPI